MTKLSPMQKKLFAKLQKLDPAILFDWDEQRCVARFIRGKLASVAGSVSPAIELEKFVNSYGALFGVTTFSELESLRERTDNIGWRHFEFVQMYEPAKTLSHSALRIEVFKSNLIAHFDPTGILVEVQSSCWPRIKAEYEPKVTRDELEPMHREFIRNHYQARSFDPDRTKSLDTNAGFHNPPRLVIYPWQGRFRLAWTTFGFGLSEWNTTNGISSNNSGLEFGEIFFDAMNAERFHFEGTRCGIETPDVGTGLGVGPLGFQIGPYAQRALNIVRVDSTNTYLLKDTTHARDIITYDAKGQPYDVDLVNFVSPSENNGKNWSRTLPTGTFLDPAIVKVSDADLLTSQQPEVDGHYFAQQVYEWYDEVSGGRAGWDDGLYPNLGQFPIRILAHTGNPDVFENLSSRKMDFPYYERTAGHLPSIHSVDGDPSNTCSGGLSGNRGLAFPLGSKSVVAHEYQHGITDFSFADINGNPGFGAHGWQGCANEGLSDAFGALCSENWLIGRDISYFFLEVRNLVFPRDPYTWNNLPGPRFCGFDQSAKDHFDDRKTSGISDLDLYDNGTILGHAAYLMCGGVHQRMSRLPELIPVLGLGTETYNGNDVNKTARIWYRAVTYYFGIHGPNTGIPATDEGVFRAFRDACVSASIDLYGVDSPEHRTTVLAFYAVGLQPVAEDYGADVTFMPWGSAWELSKPYIGLDSPAYGSHDLFVKNGSAAEWNAIINTVDANGNPTQFENTVYCRVRNVGTQDALNVQVQFFYAPAGAGIANWLPLTDSNGMAQTLQLGTLTAGTSNFPESDQNNPPVSASVKWYIPPLAAGESIDHFCLKAVVSCSNDVNPHNNEVQSNISYVPMQTMAMMRFPFQACNPSDRELPLQLVLRNTLPENWRVAIEESCEDLKLKPKESRILHITGSPIDIGLQLEPPFDGIFSGKCFGYSSEHLDGVVTETKMHRHVFSGLLSARLETGEHLIGDLIGRLDRHTGVMRGKVRGICSSPMQYGERRQPLQESVSLAVEGLLKPWRRIDIDVRHGGHSLGGLTIQILGVG